MLKGTSKSSVSHSGIFGLWLDSGQQKSGWVSRISPPSFYIEWGQSKKTESKALLQIYEISWFMQKEMIEDFQLRLAE